jgi:hypothetical protein
MRGVFGAARAALLVAVLAGPAPAQQQSDIPPPPPENFVPVTEAEVLAKLPERERALVQHETDPKARFDALLDVSDLRLADVGAKLDAHAPSLTDALVLYESVLRVADQLIRSPQARTAERDKRFKRFERRLGKQLPVLKAIVDALAYQDSTTGAAVLATVQRLRAAALDSALGVEILTPQHE